jgi:hypothetical protein
MYGQYLMILLYDRVGRMYDNVISIEMVNFC